MKTKTRDTSEYGLHYVSGLLRMESERTIANISRKTEQAMQNMQHFISQSPWSARQLLDRIREAMLGRVEFGSGTMLLLDESGNEKSGKSSVGTSRQYNGRQGKVDNCQVGVFLSVVKGRFSSWIDGEVFIPQRWFEDDYADQRQRAGIPAERQFMSKLDLGLQMIRRAKANGVPFDAVACDTLYGRSSAFRDQLAAEGVEYYADVPSNTRIYLAQPEVGIPENKRAKKARNERVLAPKSWRVEQLRHHPATVWQTVELRASERGILHADFAVIPVWTVRDDLSVHQETLIIRRYEKKCSYTLTNAPQMTPLATLARRKSQRFFIEHDNQNAKSEYGWDEFQTIGFVAWEHQLALTILAAWFIAEIKLDWAADHKRDPALLDEYEIDILPALSVANVRQMLRAAMPLPQLSTTQAAELVLEHLDNRTRSRKSRLKSHRNHLGP
jgi:SRSO17 transposase